MRGVHLVLGGAAALDFDEASVELGAEDDEDGADLEEHQRAHDLGEAGVEARVVGDGEPRAEQLGGDHPQNDGEQHARPNVAKPSLADRQP